MRVLLIAFAIGQLVLGLLLWLAPSFFHDESGPYGARNDHPHLVALAATAALLGWMLRREQELAA